MTLAYRKAISKMQTEQGKNISSRNATKHGCCSEKHLIIGDESSEDYDNLEDMWI